MNLVEAGRYEDAESLMSDDFTFIGPVPEPISGGEWLDLHRRMKEALPDFSFNLSALEEAEGRVRTTIQITGTHLNDLDLSNLGIPIIKATGRTVQLPVEHPEFTVEGGKATSLLVRDVGPDGGVSGILRQLGVEIPPPAG
ncbi:MAG: nuclear transport factor 2 family protein [Fidelibacterota bacterium]